ncbi:MAG TPA: S46 family peptidase [Bacteroidia bacterium]
MKKLFLAFAVLFSVSFGVKADEGMWLPYLLKSLNEKDMKKNGCKLTAEDIYSINKSSLKDAIVQFGGGCTGEIISDKGLLLTNHHCGYSAIADHSTVEKDYLTHGFWAMNQGEELPNPGLTAMFIIRMEDVTDKVNKNMQPYFTAIQKDSTIKANSKELEKEAVKGTHYESFTRAFYYGNMYIMFVTETFKDVRLVGAPPSFIGKFGGDTDNWVWPRHTGDFSIFRIYAGKDNKPAEYSKDNVPYIPKRSLKINIKGVEEGDFTMVYGFPGRTQEYLFSDGVDMLMNVNDPVKVSLREKRLEIMEKHMKADDQTRINYAANYASVANYWKKWLGEMTGLKVSNAVEKKKTWEKEFLAQVASNPEDSRKFNELFNEFHKIYSEYTEYSKQQDYLSEGLFGISAFLYARNFEKVIGDAKKFKEGKNDKFTADFEKVKPGLQAFHKNLNRDMDLQLMAAMLEMYDKGLKKEQKVPYIDSLIVAYEGNTMRIAKEIHANSTILNKEKLDKVLEDFPNNINTIQKDPMYMLYSRTMAYYNTAVRPYTSNYEQRLAEMYKIYMEGQLKYMKGKQFYPDANSTLRLTYGKVKGSKPKDGIKYEYYTTIDGIMEKENPAIDDYVVFPKLKELYAKKDYGQYADKNGKLRVAFIAANHTTGGNSGSPVLNAKGELIGTNFDRAWEGTMSDVMYNPDICRNISLDIRYTLFVIDKYAGAGYLVNEMNIVK